MADVADGKASSGRVSAVTDARLARLARLAHPAHTFGALVLWWRSRWARLFAVPANQAPDDSETPLRRALALLRESPQSSHPAALKDRLMAEERARFGWLDAGVWGATVYEEAARAALRLQAAAVAGDEAVGVSE